MFDCTGKIALVTGASGGIGEAVCRRLHLAGATVVATGRNAAKLGELERDLGERIHAIPCDLSDRSAIAGLVASASEREGSVSILVNNAGMTRDGLLPRMGDADWDAVLEVNLTSAMVLSRACLRDMMKARWGRIVNITSIVGHGGSGGQVNYAAAKAGLTAMSKSLAQEVARRGITVNAVAPGYIETSMTEALPEARKAEILSRIPLHRQGDPMEIAAAVHFLASDEASYVTGETIHVNGGMAMF